MAGAAHRRSVTWAAVASLLAVTLSAGSGRAAAANAGCPGVTQQAITPGTTPVLFVHGINSGPGSWTGTGTGTSGAGPVPGTGQWPLQYVQGSLGSSKVTGYTFDWSAYSGANGTTVEWVTTPLKPSLGVRLAQAIDCIAQRAGHQVIIIAHSMGGLITQYAASIDPGDIAVVFTLGTPYQGSYLASAASGQGPGGGLGLLAQAIQARCGFSRTQQGVCAANMLASETNDPGVKAMLLRPAGGWKDLPPWPASLRNRVYSLAASITGTWQPISMLNFQVTLADAGDVVVGTTSQRSSLPGWTMNCPVRLAQGATIGTAATAFDVLGASPCLHTQEPRSKVLLDYIITQVQPMLPTPAASAMAEATRVMTYSPWTASGIASGISVVSTVAGACFVGSISGPPSAYRCTGGGEIFDPCFASTYGSSGTGQVACVSDGLRSVVIVNLTSKLPALTPRSGTPEPWWIILANGRQCGDLASQRVVVRGLISVYGCYVAGGAGLLFGYPDRSSPTWTILYQRATGSALTRVSIAQVYE